MQVYGNKIVFIQARCLEGFKNIVVCDGMFVGTNSAFPMKMEASGSDRIALSLLILAIHGKSYRGLLRVKKPIFS
jgi:hypothetical protein